MKKVITAAALLAASTALANAATVITLTDLSQDASSEGITYTAETGYLSGSSLFTNIPSGGNRYSASTTLILNLTALGITDSASTWSGADTQLVDCRTSATSSTDAIGLQIADNGLRFTWGNSAWDQASDTYLTWDSLLEKSYSLGDDTCVTLTLESNMYNGGATAGTTVYDADGVATALTKTGLKSTKTYTAIYVNTDYIKSVSVFSGSATADEITAASSALYSATIPEPSAFGLLAGAGALALVAARRRRSRAK